MIIDCHGHVSAPPALWAYKSLLLSHRGSHGRGPGVRYSDDDITAALNAKEIGPKSHFGAMSEYGTDMQLISPRPFQMMHSQKPAKLVHWFTEETNNLIARHVKMFPDKFRGVAGLPQAAGEPVEAAIPELERTHKMGFVGCLLNPDPYENSGQEPPGLGERYWYPLYEKLCALDTPAHIHATGSHSERTPYTLHFINEESVAVYNLLMSDVFKDFPTLKIVVSHGGGAMPYQVGRFDAGTLRPDRGGGMRFRDRLRWLYYDTVLYTPLALELLIKTVGADRCLFGSECPGVGSSVDPETGETLDNLKPVFEKFAWLSEKDRQAIFSENAKRVFNINL